MGGLHSKKKANQTSISRSRHQAGRAYGWHSHPGLLLSRLKEEVSILRQRLPASTLYTAVSVYRGWRSPTMCESGSGNARLLVAYIVRAAEPRRIERSSPRCGEAAAPLDAKGEMRAWP